MNSNKRNTKKSQISQEDKEQIAKRIDECYNIALNFAKQGGSIGPICLNLKKIHDLAGEIGLDVRGKIDNVWAVAPVHMSQSKFYNVPSDVSVEDLLVIEPKEVSPYYRIVQKGHLGKTIVQARKAVCDMFVKSSKNLQKIIRARKEAFEKLAREKSLADEQVLQLIGEAKEKFVVSETFIGDVQNLVEEARQIALRYGFEEHLSDIQRFLGDCLGFGKSESVEQVNETLEQQIFVEETQEAVVLVEA